MVDETCGRVVKTDGLSEEAVIRTLSNALVELAENSGLRRQLSEGALARPSQFPFKGVVERLDFGQSRPDLRKYSANSALVFDALYSSLFEF